MFKKNKEIVKNKDMDTKRLKKSLNKLIKDSKKVKITFNK